VRDDQFDTDAPRVEHVVDRDALLGACRTSGERFSCISTADFVQRR